VDPVPDPLLLRKSGSAGNRTRDLWVSSQELCVIHALIRSVALHGKNDKVSTLCAACVQKFVSLSLNGSVSKFKYFLS
jgi:hypothetical protein